MSRRWEKLAVQWACLAVNRAGGRKGYERGSWRERGREDGQTPVTPCCSWPHVPGRGRDEGGDDRAKSSRCKKPISSCWSKTWNIRWNGSVEGFGGLASPYFELRKDRDGFHYSRSKIFDIKTNKFNFVSWKRAKKILLLRKLSPVW